MTNERLGLEAGKLSMARFFTRDEKSPYEFDANGKLINWVSEEVKVTDDVGKVIFTQPNVRRPDFWSSLAIKVVASKYFWGDQAKGEREDSIEKLVGRIAKFIGRQALKQKYLDEEHSKILQDEMRCQEKKQPNPKRGPVFIHHSKEYFRSGFGAHGLQGGCIGGVFALEMRQRPFGRGFIVQMRL